MEFIVLAIGLSCLLLVIGYFFSQEDPIIFAFKGIVGIVGLLFFAFVIWISVVLLFPSKPATAPVIYPYGSNY